MKTLKEVACGQTVTVKKLTGEGPDVLWTWELQKVFRFM